MVPNTEHDPLTLQIGWLKKTTTPLHTYIDKSFITNMYHEDLQYHTLFDITYALAVDIISMYILLLIMYVHIHMQLLN